MLCSGWIGGQKNTAFSQVSSEELVYKVRLQSFTAGRAEKISKRVRFKSERRLRVKLTSEYPVCNSR